MRLPSRAALLEEADVVAQHAHLPARRRRAVTSRRARRSLDTSSWRIASTGPPICATTTGGRAVGPKVDAVVAVEDRADAGVLAPRARSRRPRSADALLLARADEEDVAASTSAGASRFTCRPTRPSPVSATVPDRRARRCPSRRRLVRRGRLLRGRRLLGLGAGGRRTRSARRPPRCRGPRPAPARPASAPRPFVGLRADAVLAQVGARQGRRRRRRLALAEAVAAGAADAVEERLRRGRVADRRGRVSAGLGSPRRPSSPRVGALGLLAGRAADRRHVGRDVVEVLALQQARPAWRRRRCRHLGAHLVRRLARALRAAGAMPPPAPPMPWQPAQVSSNSVCPLRGVAVAAPAATVSSAAVVVDAGGRPRSSALASVAGAATSPPPGRSTRRRRRRCRGRCPTTRPGGHDAAARRR